MDDLEILKREIASILANYRSVDIRGQGKEASVLIPLFCREGKCCVLLTRRTQQVEYHKGEISFPGGAREASDGSLLNTALRETQEETGIDAGTIQILGKLDDTLTVVSNFVISPFVGWVSYPYRCCLNALETEEILEIPLFFFLRRENYWKSEFQYRRKSYESHFYKWNDNAVVWGATARIIYHFCQLLQSSPACAHL